MGSLGGGGGYKPDTYASQKRAEISREQWNDYQNTYVPYENEALAYINDPEAQAKEVSDAGTLAGKSFDTIQGARQRNLERMGISPRADVAKNFRSDASRSKALAQIDAKNRMRESVEQRTTSLSEEMIGVGKGVKANTDSTLQAWTQLEGINNQMKASKAAQSAASRNQMIGTASTVIMGAAMFF